MDKQEELNAYEQMAVLCNKRFSCRTCPYNPLANKESICPNFDKKLVYAMGKGYRKIPENAVVLTREEYKQFYNDERASYYRAENLVIENDLLYKKLKQARKETAEKFVKEVEEFFKPFDKKSPIFLDLLITKIENIAKEITGE